MSRNETAYWAGLHAKANSTSCLARLEKTYELAELLTQSIAQKAIDEVPTKLAQTVESIAFLVEEGRARGWNYATVQHLTEGDDFVIPSWMDRLFSKRPLRGWLSADAAFVFDYCHKAQLNVALAPCSKVASVGLTSAITIEVSPTPAPKFNRVLQAPRMSLRKSNLLDILKEHPIEYPPTPENEIRSRVASVMKHAPAIIEAIQSACDKNITDYRVFELRGISPTKYNRHLVDDVQSFCELLHLKTQVSNLKGRDGELLAAAVMACNVGTQASASPAG